MRYICTSIVATLVLAGTCFAATINVPGDYPTIQGAVDAASNGDTIIVAPGTYTSTQDGHAINMLGKSVTLRSIDPNDPAVVAATVIDGEEARRGFACFNGESPLITGFTIRNGFGAGFDYNDDGQIDWWEGCGGGMFIWNSSPQITHCTFEGNAAETYGGGVHFNTSNGAMIDCLVIDNWAPLGVGGIGIYSQSSPSIIRCDIRNNAAEYGAAGMAVEYSCNPIVNECTFATNTTTGTGAGLFIQGGSQPEFNDCIFEENSANWIGGGCYIHESDASFAGCRFTGNTADSGGGMYMDNCSPSLTHTTVCGNTPDQINGSYTDGGGNSISGVCAPSVGACCTNDVCALADEEDCLYFAGQWLGEGTTCDDSPCPTSCLGDTTGDGVVNVNDILTVIGNWGPCP